MTTPDPSREAFEKWYADYHNDACANYGGIDCTNPKGIAEEAWQAAMAHKEAERWQPQSCHRGSDVPNARIESTHQQNLSKNDAGIDMNPSVFPIGK